MPLIFCFHLNLLIIPQHNRSIENSTLAITNEIKFSNKFAADYRYAYFY